VSDPHRHANRREQMTPQARLVLWAAAVALPAALWAADSSAAREIDIQKSVMSVRVFKSGLFSAFGREHESQDGHLRGPRR